VAGEIYNEEFLNLYTLPDIFRMTHLGIIRWARYVTKMGVKRGAYINSVGKSEGKRAL
jgi:hypothetical protein